MLSISTTLSSQINTNTVVSCHEDLLENHKKNLIFARQEKEKEEGVDLRKVLVCLICFIIFYLDRNGTHPTSESRNLVFPISECFLLVKWLCRGYQLLNDEFMSASHWTHKLISRVCTAS